MDPLSKSVNKMNKLQLLRQTGVLSAKGLLALIKSIMANGISLTALLGYAAARYPERTAVHDDDEALTYAELYSRTRRLAAALKYRHGLGPGQKVALCCRNHKGLLTALFACAYTGADLFLINTEIAPEKLGALAGKHAFNLMIYDCELKPLIAACGYQGNQLPVDDAHFNACASVQGADSLPARVAYGPGSITVLTGGSTGAFKSASRKPSLLAFLNPLFTLLDKLRLSQYRKLYIATPIYHGFGLAALCLATLLGATVYLSKRFDTERASTLISHHRVEVIALVPLMLSRMLQLDPERLTLLRCIISGGAHLTPALAEQAQTRLPGGLFNLYGTSEAGVCTIATPKELHESPGTIGRPIEGLNLRLLNLRGGQPIADGSDVGEIIVRCAWSAQGADSDVATGDLAYRDKNGNYFLCGRIDDMIVSGGENVYPIELENVLITHPAVRECLVAGVEDAEFGQRLKAWVTITPAERIDKFELLSWLKPRVARYAMPVDVVLVEEIPLTAVGKPDVRRLLQQ